MRGEQTKQECVTIAIVESSEPTLLVKMHLMCLGEPNVQFSYLSDLGLLRGEGEGWRNYENNDETKLLKFQQSMRIVKHMI